MDFDKPKVYGDTSIIDGLVFNQIVIRQESLEGILTTEEAREAVQSFLADVNILVLAHLEPDLERQWHTRPPPSIRGKCH